MALYRYINRYREMCHLYPFDLISPGSSDIFSLSSGSSLVSRLRRGIVEAKMNAMIVP
ncbi:hypothetical protein OAK49_03360 [Euryarchaeota archaeon]|nr:hypothetical protein [Euryarchaeota archaeon]